MPAGAIYVGRPTKWGNPWRIYDDGVMDRLPTAFGRALAVTAYREWVAGQRASTMIPQPPPTVDEIRAALAGHDLVCWCPPGPCHADVLIELANAEAGA